MYSPRKELSINLSFLVFQKNLEIHSIQTLFRILKVALYLFFHQYDRVFLYRTCQMDTDKFHPEHSIIASQLTELAQNWISAHSLLLKHA